MTIALLTDKGIEQRKLHYVWKAWSEVLTDFNVWYFLLASCSSSFRCESFNNKIVTEETTDDGKKVTCTYNRAGN